MAMMNLRKFGCLSGFAAMVMISLAGTRWGKRVYLDMERLREVTHTAAEVAIA
jgi:hypothetical protein